MCIKSWGFDPGPVEQSSCRELGTRVHLLTLRGGVWNNLRNKLKGGSPEEGENLIMGRVSFV